MISDKKVITQALDPNTVELLVVRLPSTDTATEGSMFYDGKFECYTLEDPVRKEKVYGKTAIPAGRYEVILNMSNRFKRVLPLLLGVSGFDGIRIHRGNKAKDTLGCILVGDQQTSSTDDFIGMSKQAEERLIKKLEADKAKGKKIFITIK